MATNTRPLSRRIDHTALRSLGTTRALLSSFLKSGSKYAAFLLLLAYARSWPFGWHARVFLPLIKLRLQQLVLRLQMRLRFFSREDQRAATIRWFESLLPIGKNPFEFETTYRSWVGLDDGDFNLHLSNSSYPKVMDAARFKAGLAFFPATFRSGVSMALGGTHFAFLREIPMFTKYEVRVGVASWDEKWIYVVARFVTHPTKSKTKPRSNFEAKRSETQETNALADTDSSPASSLEPFKASMRMPGVNDLSGTSTPSGPSTTIRSLPLENLTSFHPLALEEGAVLNCIAVSQLVFKHGRITIPPGLAVALNGFSHAPTTGPGEARLSSYSHANPPPHWPELLALLSRPVSATTELLCGGWRSVPPEARWWETALSAEVEERRKANLERVRGVREGMDGILRCF